MRKGVSERSVKYSTLVQTAEFSPGLLWEWAISDHKSTHTCAVTLVRCNRYNRYNRYNEIQ